MDFLERYKKRVKANTTRQEHNKTLQKSDFEYFMNYAPNVYLAKKWKKTDEFSVNIQDVSWSNKYGDEKYFNTFNHVDIKIGDVIQVDDFSDRLWLITEETYKSIKSHKNFRVRPCTYILKYFLPNELNIVETPCIIDNATKYSTGVEEANRLSTGNARRSIWIPRNKYTEQITHSMRFFTQKGVWVVTTLDYDTEPNLIILTCTEDEYNPLIDNEELQIANYYNRNLSLEVLNIINDMKIELNKEIKIKYVIKNNSDIIDKFKPTVISSDENIVIVDDDIIKPINEGICEIEIKLTNDIVYKYNIEVIKENATAAEIISIIGEDKLRLQTYEEYYSTVDLENIEWKLICDFNNELELINKNDMHCKLYIDDKKYLKQSFKLQLWSNNKLLKEKEIKIINII